MKKEYEEWIFLAILTAPPRQILLRYATVFNMRWGGGDFTQKMNVKQNPCDSRTQIWGVKLQYQRIP